MSNVKMTEDYKLIDYKVLDGAIKIPYIVTHQPTFFACLFPKHREIERRKWDRFFSNNYEGFESEFFTYYQSKKLPNLDFYDNKIDENSHYQGRYGIWKQY